jgi:CelD/BcsL family acetyltransferase involved in cellulose biosynthesis
MAANTTQETFRASACTGNLEYRIYSHLSEIAGLRRQWDELLARSSCNRAFGSLEWYLASCRNQDFLKPYLMTVARGDELICILPLALDLRTGIGAFPHLENDTNDALVRSDDPAPLAGLLQYALSDGLLCHQIQLSKLQPESQCVRAVSLLNRNLHIQCGSRDMKSYQSIKLPSNFDEYLASRGKLFRRNIKRALRSNNENGWVIREVYPQDLSPLELPEVFLQLILDRHRTRCAFHQMQAQSFVREVLPPLFSKGDLRAFAMFHRQKIAAIDLYLSARDGLLAWNGGFSAEAEHRSPGTALIAFAIQQAIATGLQDLDFGEGDEAYKQNWSNHSYAIRELDLIKT